MSSGHRNSFLTLPYLSANNSSTYYRTYYILSILRYMFSKILYRSVFLVNPWARHHYSPSHTEKNEVDCSCLPWSLPWPSSSNPNSNRSSVDHLGGPSTKLWFCFWPRGLLARQPWENGYNLRGHGFLVFDWGALLRQNGWSPCLWTVFCQAAWSAQSGAAGEREAWLWCLRPWPYDSPLSIKFKEMWHR